MRILENLKVENLNIVKTLIMVCSLFAVSSHVSATAISTANAFFDLDSVRISNDPSIGYIELESYVSVNNDDGERDSSQIGDINLTDSLSGFNVEAFTGNDGDNFLNTLTETDSLFGDLSDASATSFLSVLIPFTNDFSSRIGVSFDFELFASAETDATGEYALATAGYQYALLDNNFGVLDTLEKDIFVEALDGGFNDDFSDGGFFTEYQNLGMGDYYLAIDLFSASFTEAITPAASVPSPGTLALMFVGLAFISRRKILKREKNQILIAA